MGKIIIVSVTSILFCGVVLNVAINHQIGDFCNVPPSGDLKCSDWDLTSLSVFVFSLLFHGALLGLFVNYIFDKICIALCKYKTNK